MLSNANVILRTVQGDPEKMHKVLHTINLEPFRHKMKSLAPNVQHKLLSTSQLKICVNDLNILFAK